MYQSFPRQDSQTRRRSQESKKSRAQRQTRLIEVDRGWLGETIGFNLRIAHEAAVRTYLQSVADTGAPAWRFAILNFIHLNPGLTQGALAQAVLRDSSSLTGALDKLCKAGLVSRIRPKTDRRSYQLRLTSKGVRSMEQLRPKVQTHERDLDRAFTSGERRALIAMLKKIAAIFSSRTNLVGNSASRMPRN